MIVTILPGSSDFHAVGYNERKVSKGVARLLEMQNSGDSEHSANLPLMNWSSTFRNIHPGTAESGKPSIM